ncbi:hypothetical protein FOL47_009059 [Perkinsus chesapeaki]|uniref:RAP domain-containing protein n=1 Tax=Perkinsus chesapeaki TaxID=330153 RepID=A0A7J6MSH6_PERCH|nr:hypothetical protein FOL47_009059 [Perkinsus chesapeaki]
MAMQQHFPRLKMSTGQAMGSLTYRVANAPTVDNLLFHLSNEPMDRVLMPKVLNAALSRVAKLATVPHRGENGSIVFDKVISIILKGVKCRQWDNRNLAGAFWAVAKFHTETTETPLPSERVVELFEALAPYVKQDACTAVDVSNILWALGTFQLAMSQDFRYSSLVEDLAASLCVAWCKVLASSEPGSRAVSTTAWGAVTVLADHRLSDALNLLKSTLSHAIPRLDTFKPPEIAMLLHMVVRCRDAQNLPEVRPFIDECCRAVNPSQWEPREISIACRSASKFAFPPSKLLWKFSEYLISSDVLTKMVPAQFSITVNGILVGLASASYMGDLSKFIEKARSYLKEANGLPLKFGGLTEAQELMAVHAILYGGECRLTESEAKFVRGCARQAISGSVAFEPNALNRLLYVMASIAHIEGEVDLAIELFKHAYDRSGEFDEVSVAGFCSSLAMLADPSKFTSTQLPLVEELVSKALGIAESWRKPDHERAGTAKLMNWFLLGAKYEWNIPLSSSLEGLLAETAQHCHGRHLGIQSSAIQKSGHKGIQDAVRGCGAKLKIVDEWQCPKTGWYIDAAIIGAEGEAVMLIECQGRVHSQSPYLHADKLRLRILQSIYGEKRVVEAGASGLRLGDFAQRSRDQVRAALASLGVIGDDSEVVSDM